MRRRQALRVTLAMISLVATSVSLQAAPYASNVSVTGGTTVNFILNEPADALTYSINGGAALILDGTTKGAKTFMLGAPTDTFSIFAEKTAAVGYTIPTGGTVYTVDPDPVNPPDLNGVHGLNEPSDEAGLSIISDDASLLARFNSPRGVSVSNNPNAPHFGSAYISNSAAGTTGGRTLVGEGLYALRADGSDAFGFGDTGQNPTVSGFLAWVTTSGNSPFRTFVADDGNVYVADFSDANGSLIQVSPNLSSAVEALPNFGGPTALPAGRNHGSTTAVHTEGSIAAGNLVVYTVDEDLTTNYVTGAGTTLDRNSLWRYDVNGGPLPSAVTPTRVSDVLISGATSDMARGADGKFYLMQTRNGNPGDASLFVVSADGTSVLFNSLEETREIKSDPLFTRDILQYTNAVAVSADQKWLALMLNGSDVAVLPLVDGIPQLADRMVVKSAVDVFAEFTGRDIAFDAAGNIHYVSSGQGRYRVLAPGGHTLATTSFDGTDFDFTLAQIGVGDAGFDTDGDVDGGDFLTWQRGLGLSGGAATQMAGNANGDTVINGDDLAVWRTQFGVPAVPAAGAVPEPAACGLAVAAFAAAAAFRKPRRD